MMEGRGMIARIDKYILSVDGYWIEANEEQEKRIRRLTREQRNRLLEILTGKPVQERVDPVADKNDQIVIPEITAPRGGLQYGERRIRVVVRDVSGSAKRVKDRDTDMDVERVRAADNHPCEGSECFSVVIATGCDHVIVRDPRITKLIGGKKTVRVGRRFHYHCVDPSLNHLVALVRK